jgi:hypothetical protein
MVAGLHIPVVPAIWIALLMVAATCPSGAPHFRGPS